MSAAGAIHQNTSDKSPLWWLAAEILVAAMEPDTFNVPEGTDPRLHFAKEWPDLHAYWMKRIREYGPALFQPFDPKVGDLNA